MMENNTLDIYQEESTIKYTGNFQKIWGSDRRPMSTPCLLHNSSMTTELNVNKFNKEFTWRQCLPWIFEIHSRIASFPFSRGHLHREISLNEKRKSGEKIHGGVCLADLSRRNF
jgi:hypothetical protein